MAASRAVSVKQVVTDRAPRTAEGWARAVFEEGPALLRGFVAAGWRLVLLLRLGPRTSPDHVAGWAVVDRSPAHVALEAESPLLAAQNTIDVTDSCVTWTTTVHYRRGVARVIWAVALPVHRLTVRYLLRRAADGA